MALQPAVRTPFRWIIGECCEKCETSLGANDGWDKANYRIIKYFIMPDCSMFKFMANDTNRKWSSKIRSLDPSVFPYWMFYKFTCRGRVNEGKPMRNAIMKIIVRPLMSIYLFCTSVRIAVVIFIRVHNKNPCALIVAVFYYIYRESELYVCAKRRKYCFFYVCTNYHYYCNIKLYCVCVNFI